MPSSAKKPDLIAKLQEVLQTGSTDMLNVGLDDDVPSGSDPIDPNDDLLAQTIKELNSEPLTTIPAAKRAKVETSPVKTTTTPAALTSPAKSVNVADTPSAPIVATEPTGPKTISLIRKTLTVQTTGVSKPAEETTTAVVVKAAAAKPDSKDAIAARAARFGGPNTNSAAATRAARFATGLAGGDNGTASKPAVDVKEQLEALKKRSEKFGVAVSDSVKKLEVQEKMVSRAERFNISEEDRKKELLGLKRKKPGTVDIDSSLTPGKKTDQQATAQSKFKFTRDPNSNGSSGTKSTISAASIKTSLTPLDEEKLKKRKERFAVA